MVRFIACLFYLISYVGYCQSASEQLNQLLLQIENKENYKHAQISVYAVNCKTGKQVYTWKANQLLLPASVCKLVTTGTALLYLDTGFRFKTTISHTGYIDPSSGFLYGDIIITGYGDPTLGSDRFSTTGAEQVLKKCVTLIKNSGITRVLGNIVADASAFGSAMAVRTWIWADIGNYYGAGATGLNYRENYTNLYINSPAVVGRRTTIKKVEPVVPGAIWINKVVSGEYGSSDQAYAFGGDYQKVRYIRGHIPPGKNYYRVKVTLPDPAYQLAYEVYKMLDKKDIPVKGYPKTMRMLKLLENKPNYLKDIQKIGNLESPPLLDIIKATNHRSINLYAEAIQRYLGYKAFGKGTTKNANMFVRNYWLKQGIVAKTFFPADGCGLSRYNAYTAKSIGDFLLKMYTSNIGEKFKNTLPVSGESGTMRYVGNNTALQGRWHAKSGTMKQVKAYAGYLTTIKGNTLALVIIFNHFTASFSDATQQIEKTAIQMLQF